MKNYIKFCKQNSLKPSAFAALQAYKTKIMNYILIEITDYKGGELRPPKTSKNLIDVLEETLDTIAQRILYTSSTDEKIQGKEEIIEFIFKSVSKFQSYYPIACCIKILKLNDQGENQDCPKDEILKAIELYYSTQLKQYLKQKS